MDVHGCTERIEEAIEDPAELQRIRGEALRDTELDEGE